MTLYGIIYAIMENDSRRILAYSIINQVGFMVCGIGIGTGNGLKWRCGARLRTYYLQGVALDVCRIGALYDRKNKVHRPWRSLQDHAPHTDMLLYCGGFNLRLSIDERIHHGKQ